MLGCGPLAMGVPVVLYSWRRCGVVLPPFGRDEIGDGHGLVAMGTVPTGANPAAEDATLSAALLADIPRLAGGALVHRHRA
jgi:hypothetical protein